MLREGGLTEHAWHVAPSLAGLALELAVLTRLRRLLQLLAALPVYPRWPFAEQS
jgi:hypothetical protein